MKIQIVKTELLWSRACHLTCAGCAMPNPLRHGGMRTRHGGTPEEWDRGMKRLASMGAQVVAIYGAEPLLRPKGLPEVIRSIYGHGMNATVISAMPDNPRMRELLEDTPLDSITMSYDAVDEDPSRTKKAAATQRAIAELIATVPDMGTVVTVTQENVGYLADITRKNTARGVWTLFDLLHGFGGNGSKCGHVGALKPPGVEEMKKAAQEMLDLKRGGALIHASERFLLRLIDRYDGEPRNFWHCTRHEGGARPTGWLTVDADGSILACDDWQHAYPDAKIWDDFTDEALLAWLQPTREKCLGCAWNTNQDACDIELGLMERGTYVHATSGADRDAAKASVEGGVA